MHPLFYRLLFWLHAASAIALMMHLINNADGMALFKINYLVFAAYLNVIVMVLSKLKLNSLEAKNVFGLRAIKNNETVDPPTHSV